MKITKRVVAVLLCVAMVVAVMHVGNTANDIEIKNIFDGNNSVILWYTDDSMTDYLSACAVAFHEQYGIRVLPRLQSGSDYIESVYDASMAEEEVPDLYIASNEVLEKAYLSGTAGRIEDEAGVISEASFPKTALQAVTYQEQLIGYPYYFETSALLYNKTYLNQMADNLIAAETAEEPTEAAAEEETQTEETTAVAVTTEEKVAQLIPTTFDELLTFADEYDAPEAVEAVFKWDVSDIFYNYFFIGNYMNIGGPCGDRTDEINIYNLDAIEAMKVYQNLNQFFSFETDDVAYDGVISEFMEGKLVLTTATTDIMKKLDEAKKDGTFAFEYGLARIPDLNDTLKSRSLSVTNTVVVNGYSNKKELANQFAKYLVFDQADTLYEKTGKIPSCKNITVTDSNISVFQQEYENSVPIPKMMATSNYWVQLEISFAEVWSGKEVSASLKDLSELIMTQVTGEPYSETYIEEPKEETETIEYLDEEAEREAAKQEE